MSVPPQDLKTSRQQDLKTVRQGDRETGRQQVGRTEDPESKHNPPLQTRPASLEPSTDAVMLLPLAWLPHPTLPLAAFGRADWAIVAGYFALMFAIGFAVS